jgi:hypothetical protein
MGLLSNKYDVEQGINDAMTSTALSFGRLASPRFAPMTASTALQGDMAGRGIGMMVGGQDPRITKQNTVDEIMKKHPDPSTPEELEAVANDLQAAGLMDLAVEIRAVANETKKADAATTKANAPSADLFKNLSSALSSQVLTTKFMDNYFRYANDEDLSIKYNRDTSSYDTYTAYKDGKKSHREDLENLFTQWANSKKHTGTTKDELATLMNDDEEMTKDFVEWIGHHGNVELSNFMKQAIMGGTQGGDDSDPSGLSIIEGYVAKGLDETDNMVIAQRKIISNYVLEDVNRNLKIILDRNQDSLSEVDKVRLELLKEKKAQLEKLAKESSESNDAESSTMAAGASPYTPDMASWFMPDMPEYQDYLNK